MDLVAALTILAAPFVAVIVLVGWRLGRDVVRQMRDNPHAALTSETVREALQHWTGDELAPHDGDEQVPGSGLTRESDDPPGPQAEGGPHLTQQPGGGPVPTDMVAPSLVKAAEHRRCPACSAPITVNDDRCPSCDISFISDGSQMWTLSAVGPADGICLPPTEVGE
jgi:hypothetical protein